MGGTLRPRAAEPRVFDFEPRAHDDSAMKQTSFWIRCALLGFGLTVSAISAIGSPPPPQAVLKDLYVAVESAQIFSDSKSFADAVPKSAPAEILARFHAAKPDSKQALSEFVAANFVMPSPVSVAPAPAERVAITAAHRLRSGIS